MILKDVSRGRVLAKTQELIGAWKAMGFDKSRDRSFEHPLYFILTVDSLTVEIRFTTKNGLASMSATDDIVVTLNEIPANRLGDWRTHQNLVFRRSLSNRTEYDMPIMPATAREILDYAMLLDDEEEGEVQPDTAPIAPATTFLMNSVSMLDNVIVRSDGMEVALTENLPRPLTEAEATAQGLFSMQGPRMVGLLLSFLEFRGESIREWVSLLLPGAEDRLYNGFGRSTQSRSLFSELFFKIARRAAQRLRSS